MPLLMEGCPSYRLPAEDQELLYIVLGDFARHLLQLQQQSRTEEFANVARAIELHTQATEKYPQNLRARYYLAEELAQQDKKEDAKAELQKVLGGSLEYDPRKPDSDQ